jgi:hypothetical protein
VFYANIAEYVSLSVIRVTADPTVWKDHVTTQADPVSIAGILYASKM